MLSLLNIRSKWSTAQVFAHFVVEVLGQKDNSRSHTFIFKLMDYSACVATSGMSVTQKVICLSSLETPIISHFYVSSYLLNQSSSQKRSPSPLAE
jgi:hypothetical protein